MTAQRALIAVVDDDESVRESLPDLLRELGFDARPFASAQEYLSSDCVALTRCLVIDVFMPGMSGPDLHGALTRSENSPPPVVFMSANGSEELFSTLVERGAVACLSKPFGEEALLAAITAAMREPDHDRK